MNQRVSAYRMDGENHIPLNVPSVPGIDEQMIAREEATIAIAKMRVAKRIRKNEEEAMANKEKEAGRKAALEEAAHAQACDPNVCHCHGNRQHCHLNVQHPDNGRVLTRSSVCCISC